MTFLFCLDLFIYFICANILPVCEALVPVEFRRRYQIKRGHLIPWNWSSESVKLPCRCWESNLVLLPRAVSTFDHRTIPLGSKCWWQVKLDENRTSNCATSDF